MWFEETMRKSLVIKFSYDIEMRKLANRNIAIICALYMAYNSRQPDCFRAVCHWIKERYEAGNTVIFCSISFLYHFVYILKNSVHVTGVHQLVILIKSGCICNQLVAGFLKRLKIPVCSITLVMVKKIKESIGHMIKFFTVRIGRIARNPFP